MKNQTKLEQLKEIAKQLNLELNSVPILYGSLGLSILIDQDLETDDIDLLIEQRIFKNDLAAVRLLMEGSGFELIDPEENTFLRGAVKVGISNDGDMVEFSGINPDQLTIIEDSAKCRVLTPKQYLATYRVSSLDGYRIDERQKNDDAKIKLLESWLGA